MLALVLAVCASGVLAQDQSDKDRLTRGIELFNAKKYQEAIDLLQAVNKANLPDYDQNKPELYITKARESLTDQKSAAQQMALGEQALTSEKFAQAMARFAEAKKIDYLSADDAKRLQSLATLAKDGEAALRTKTLLKLQAAKTAETAGQTADAVAAYQAVLASDVNLDPADKDYAVKHLATLKGGAGATVPAEVKPVVAAVTPTDVKVAQADTGLKPVVTPSEPAKAVETPAEKPAEVIVTPAEKPAEVVVTPAEKPVEVVETPKIDVEALRQQAIKARVAEDLAQADAALAAGDVRAAKMAYVSVLARDENNAAAKAGIDKIDALSGHGTRSLLVRESDRLSVEGQRLQAQIRETVATAGAIKDLAEKPEDFDKALSELKYAYRQIDQSNVLTPEQAEDLREEVKTQWDAVAKAQADMVAVQKTAIGDEIRRQEEARREADAKARERQIDSLWTQSQQLVSRYQYKEAVSILDQLLIVAPSHEKARRFRQDYAYLASLAEQVTTRDDRKRESRDALALAEEAAVPWNDLYRYPDAKTWADLTAKRKKFVQGASGESEIVQATRRKLRTKGVIDGAEWSITLSLTGTGLGSVLDFIAEAARARPREITINIDRTGITAAGVGLDDPIDLQVKDVSIDQALHMVLGTTLGYVVQDDGSVLISSRERLNENLPVTAYFVGDLITQVPDFSNTAPSMNRDLATPAVGGAGGGGAGAGAGGGLFATDTATTETTESGTERLRTLIERTVRSSEPWESMGGRATLDFYERSGLMLVSQTPDGHQKLQDLLENLRRERAIMINVESRFITVNDSFLNDVTVDFDIEFNSGHTGSSWGNRNATNWGGNSAYNSTIPANTFETLGNEPNPFTIGNTSSNGFGTTTLLPGLSTMGGLFAGTWGANEGGMVFAGSFLDDIQVGFLIRAIQADIRSTTLFAPRITLWNGQRSWISDGTMSAYVSDLEPVVAEAAVSFDPTISYLTSGSVLDVKATASADRRYVQLDLRPQVALPPDLSRETTIVAGAIANASATITLPTVRMTHLMTSVSVPDGGTLLIAGLKSFEEHDVESGVPILSKMPILKRIFSNRAQVRGQSNMLVLVKPTIIIQAEKEEELGVDNMTGY